DDSLFNYIVKKTSSKVLHDYIKNQSFNEKIFESKKDCGFTPQSSLVICVFPLLNGRFSTLETNYFLEIVIIQVIYT
ncbi:hypothetical protein ACRCJ1_10530, partial [Aerococcus sp. L_4]